MSDFKEIDYWRSIIHFGLNTATYKPALSICLLKAARAGHEEIMWQDLSKSFFDIYSSRLEENAMPQQGTIGRQTKLERIINQTKIGKLTTAQAIDAIEKDGFVDVVPRFHTIGNDKHFAADKFYDVNFGKKIIIKNTLLQIAHESFDDLVSESEARWAMLEGSFKIRHSDYNFSLANSIREMYLRSGSKRKTLTHLKPFLAPFQADVCFYCGLPMEASHVDHVLPRSVLQHDKLWNLVLAHEICNFQKLDYLVTPLVIEKLVKRNENIMGSTNRKRAEIHKELGATPSKRASSIKLEYERVTTVLGKRWWGGSKDFNPETDPFYQSLITKLNSKIT